MPNPAKPAVSLINVPGRLKSTIDLAREIESRGYSGIFSPSFGDAMGFCQTLAHETEHIPFGTSIVNIYTRHVADYAQSATMLHELSAGRFIFGVGVSHTPMNAHLGIQAGKPLADMRQFVAGLEDAAGRTELPRIVLAALRDPMVKLAGNIADGLVFANGSRSRMAHSRSILPTDQSENESFFFGNMIPICICDDIKAAAARNRRTMLIYFKLPNYREYWKTAGYEEEMNEAEIAAEQGNDERLTELMTDRWLADCTLYGTAADVREGLEAWYDAGVKTPILVPSSAVGNQMKAFEELFSVFG